MDGGGDWSSRLPRFIGPYSVEEPLGSGGMGVVVGGRHRLLGRRVALKIRPRGREDTDEDERLLSQRFRLGAILQSELDHPHVARVYDYLESPTLQAIVLQFLEGGSVEQIIHERRGPLEVDQAVRIALYAADALDYAHRRGVIHRDVKPGNLMLVGPPSAADVRITDFGVAKQLKRSPDLTQAGANVGTLWYMPPEQFNHETPTPKVDVYGLGATLYEMLTGHIPFASPDHAELFRRFLDGVPPPDMRARNPAIPEALEAVVDLALELDAGRRLPSAAAFCLLLRAVAQRHGYLDETEAARLLHGRVRKSGELACLDAIRTGPRHELRAALNEIGLQDEGQEIGVVTAVRRFELPPDDDEDHATLSGQPVPALFDDDEEDHTVIMDEPGRRREE